MSDDEGVRDRGPAAQDIPAEKAILSSMMRSKPAFDEVTSRGGLTGAEFYQPRHQVIFAVMLDLNEAGKPVEPMAILSELTDRKELSKVGGAEYLHTLLSNPTVPASAGFYADRVKLLYRVRRVAQVAERVMQATEEVEPDQVQEAVAGFSIELNLLVDETDTQDVQGLSSWQDFMSIAPDPSDWVVKGLLEKQDVMFVLSKSGTGKSWLSRQMTLCISAGVHPFRFTPIPPKRTLLVDLENPTSALRRQAEAIYVAAEHKGMPIGHRGHVWSFPEGFNLRKRADAMLLEQVVAEVRPDLMCLGSLYNAYDRGRDDHDTAAEQVKAVFNRLRQRYGCALWIEAHMPKAAGGGHVASPFGSSIWERWPGFGRVIERIGDNAYEFAEKFRGDRDANREFPLGLYKGGDFPWSPIWDQAELDSLRG